MVKFSQQFRDVYVGLRGCLRGQKMSLDEGKGRKNIFLKFSVLIIFSILYEIQYTKGR